MPENSIWVCFLGINACFESVPETMLQQRLCKISRRFSAMAADSVVIFGALTFTTKISANLAPVYSFGSLVSILRDIYSLFSCLGHCFIYGECSCSQFMDFLFTYTGIIQVFLFAFDPLKFSEIVTALLKKMFCALYKFVSLFRKIGGT